MNTIIRSTLGIAAIISMVLATGCKTVVRENIISSVETGIGVTLAENPKTEMYEAKVGYIRSQFYSVPTGKVVENDGSKSKDEAAPEDRRSNSADVTPELVSGIRMNSDARHLLLGMTVAENFAVGKVAVMSPAAAAMYVAEGKKENAADAALAAKAVADSPEFTNFKTNIGTQKTNYADIRKTYELASPEDKKKILDAAIKLEVVAADTKEANFVKRLTLYLDGTSEHTEKLNNLAETIKH